MGKIVSKARRLRLNLQAKEARRISIQEVASQLDIDRKRLNQIELGKMDRINMEELARLCEFYGVGVADVLEYDSNKLRAVSQGAGVTP